MRYFPVAMPLMINLPRLSYDETRYSGFADVDENQWYGANKNGVIETVVNLGLMSGYPDGKMCIRDSPGCI